MKYKLTEYSHGAGCGCKLSPGVLSDILGSNHELPHFQNLLVGNDTKDDAAVVDLDGKTAIVSTTDFFMPIVDDPFDFGAIAATNAISDIYAMGAEPIMAIAILGWPIDKLPAQVAARVLEGGRSVCTKAGIPLAGGHSIDSPEPIFGLAVTGKVPISQIKRNTDGRVGDLLYLTKPLGVGIVTTAQKKKLADEEDLLSVKKSMLTLNSIGAKLSQKEYVHAVTDVTGFGLAGHLLELCEAGKVGAILQRSELPVFEFVEKYLELGCIPGGTNRNWAVFGSKVGTSSNNDFKILADPQTSGGLLISISTSSRLEFEEFMRVNEVFCKNIGELTTLSSESIVQII